MDNLSDYVPLIIIIGSIIYSIVKGTNKKKEEELSKTTLPGRKIPVEVSTPPMNPVVRPVKKEKKKTFFPKQEPAIVHQAAAPFIRNTEPVELEVIEEQGEPILDIEDTGEIQKAVIYAEIFNRRNYSRLIPSMETPSREILSV
jgi:hypothetical protein